MSTQKTADILIIGAGVMGASTAFHLAKRKPGRILILEKEHVAFGGSGRSSALVRMHYSFPAEVQLAVKSLQIFQKWSEIVERPGDFRKTGFLRIVQEQEIDRLKANVEMQRQLGVHAIVASRDELREIEPGWNFDDVPAAAYEPDSGFGDGSGVAGDFLSRAREMGAEYRSGTQVIAPVVQNGKIIGVQTTDGVVEAPVVAVAIGPWTRPFLQQIGVDLPIEIEYHQVGILRNPSGMKPWSCACIDSIQQVYFRSESGGLTLAGDFYGPRIKDPESYPKSGSEDTVLDTGLRISHRIPALQEASILRVVKGVYDMSPDSRPLLGEVPGVHSLYIMVGFSGMGFKISPAVGLTMSELILDGKASTVDIGAFYPGRFADGKPIKAPLEYQYD